MVNILDFYRNLFSLITLSDFISLKFLLLLTSLIFASYPLFDFYLNILPKEILKIFEIECLRLKNNSNMKFEEIIKVYKYLFKSSINTTLITILLLVSLLGFISDIMNLNQDISIDIVSIIVMFFIHLSLFMVWIISSLLLISIKDLYLITKKYPKYIFIKAVLKQKGNFSIPLIFIAYRVQIYVSYALYMAKVLFLSIFFTKILFL